MVEASSTPKTGEEVNSDNKIAGIDFEDMMFVFNRKY